MRKFLLAISIILCGAGQICSAQSTFEPAPVEVSSDKVRKNGKLYYAHIVKENQTLYSIAKAYGVPVIEIIEANRYLKLDSRPIQPGNLLLIPLGADASRTKPATVVLPAEPVQPAEEPSAPQQPAVAPEEPSSVAEQLNEEDREAEQQTESEQADDFFEVNIPERINLALILPINAKGKVGERYINFYMGSLLALRDLANEGLKLDVNILDSFDTDSLAYSAALAEAHVTLGPVSTQDIQTALQYLPEDKYIISPMDTKTVSLVNEGRVILAATPADYQMEDALNWCTESMFFPPEDTSITPADSLIIIREEGKADTPLIKEFNKELRAKEIPTEHEIAYRIVKGLEMDGWFDLHTHLADTVTHIMVASENDAFLKESIRAVCVQSFKNKNVNLYGPAKIRVAEMEDLCNARLHASTSYHINYKEPSVQEFVMNYRALFNTDPDSFAFHGYDTVMYFVHICAKYGCNWPQALSMYSESGLQTNFKFDDKGENQGYVNHGIRRVVYYPGLKSEILR